MESTFRQITETQKIHLGLGPRTAYLIGSEREDGSSHLCAASNVTNVGIDPQLVVAGLWPIWETTANIRRTGEFTINLMDVAYIDDIWIVGSKYSKVELLPDDDKFVVGGFSQLPSHEIRPSGVKEALAVLECRVTKIIDDLSDHVIFLAYVVYAQCQRQFFDSDFVIDVHRAHPVMQIAWRYFSQCDPCPLPDTEWCSEVAADRRSRADQKR